MRVRSNSVVAGQRSAAVSGRERLSTVVGKFIHVGAERFFIRGVTYGTFAPDAEGHQFPPSMRVAEDFRRMPRAGINTVRTYTVPDTKLLDELSRNGLQAIVGIPWTQHVAFLDERQMSSRIRRDVVAQVRRLAAHPAVLLIALGNEIPAAVVRWHGPTRTERFLRELFDEAKAVAPEALFTYVNYPPTEYLELPFLDVCAFNVYLHREPDLRSYLARLQHVAGSRPLLIAEAGADSIREGQRGQAELVAMQLRASFSEGACGAVAFAWTDEWWRGGYAVSDWAFGLVDSARQPKRALDAVARVYAEVPFREAERRTWPKVSVVVCAYNASDTIDDCLASIARLTYPNYEIIVVNDGSRDRTSEIAMRHALARVIDIPNGGLAAARNVGLEAATGEIIAYTDADVRVDPDWLSYLVQPLLTSDVVGVGGPNVVPADDPWMAQCVARSPGGPTHVLLDDRIAEHIPGCNMAFRRDALKAIGGFDPIYVRAGDDVDVCWRLQKQAGRLGFAASALVWHHHRSSVRAYWRQQVGYGEGEQWLMPHHPEKFSRFSIRWRGYIYSSLPLVRSTSSRRINSGKWGTSPFPAVYRNHRFTLTYLPHSLTWQTILCGLIVLGLSAAVAGRVSPGVLLMSIGAAGLLVTTLLCVRHASKSDLRSLTAVGNYSLRTSQFFYRAVIAWLHLIQPLARARGRIRGLLSPQGTRRRALRRPPLAVDLRSAFRLLAFLRLRKRYWSETWTSAETVLPQIVNKLQSARAAVTLEVDDGWQTGRDIRVSVGAWARLDLRALVEDHASDRCVVRIGLQLRPTLTACAFSGAFAAWLVVGFWTELIPPSIKTAGAALLVTTFVRVAWRVASAATLADRAIAQVAAEGAMIPMPPQPARRSAPAQSSGATLRRPAAESH